MRKKILFLIGVAVVVSFSISAKVVTTTYYGTKARNSEINPCKGRTTRVCGTISTTLPDVPNSGMLQQTIRDENGKIIAVDYLPFMGTQEYFISKTMEKAPENAIVTVYEDEYEGVQD